MIDLAIETNGLCRDFGARRVIDQVTLQVPRGTIFGLLGINGSGKTTTIKMLMGHLRPTLGSVRILGRAYPRDLLEIRRRVGYVSENRYLYDWMSVEETLRFASAFHETWDVGKADQLLQRFELSPRMKVKHLSRGNRARLCLVVALAFNPELIILDEPTSGLDAIIRRDFIENMIDEIEHEGRTVLFSTHLVDEVERVADTAAIIHDGKLKIAAPVEALKNSIKKVRFSTNGQPLDFGRIRGLIKSEAIGREQLLTIRDFNSDTMAMLCAAGAVDPQVIHLSLEDVFVEAVRLKAL